ncbi:MAG: YggS family pyridoxal phosphate-dependent enzyme [Frankiales bacterium]|nr:YggS family pyridoxal phosphate-dependent enzyme [Frankiales bacterium]
MHRGVRRALLASPGRDDRPVRGARLARRHGGPVTAGRRAELAANLDEVRRRIAVACAAAGRSADEVTLVAVTKTWPAADVRLLADLGVTDVGENRDQEARPKHDACADLALRWHFVGRLQRNKVRSVAGYADVIHSVDRPELVNSLAAAAGDGPERPIVLVQVSLDLPPTEGRGGAPPERVLALARRVSESGLRLGGLMAVAPMAEQPDAAFARLADIAAKLRADHPSATVLSAGMSGDLEAAIRHGATHVRIGTALLGRRAPRLG